MIKYFVFTVLLVFVYWSLASSSVFIARNIECYTQYGSCPSEWLSLLSPLHSVPLLKPLPTKRATSLLSQSFQIGSVSLCRRLPGTLVVSLKLRQPLGSLGPAVLGSQIALVDTTGVVYSQTDSSNLPLLVTPDLPKAATTVSPSEVTALSFLNLLAASSPGRLVGYLTGDTLQVIYPTGLEVLVSISKSSSKWHPYLQLVLDRSKIDQKIPHKIDLRFNRPVISY